MAKEKLDPNSLEFRKKAYPYLQQILPALNEAMAKLGLEMSDGCMGEWFYENADVQVRLTFEIGTPGQDFETMDDWNDPEDPSLN